MERSIFEKPRARGESCCWCDSRATHCLYSVSRAGATYETACKEHRHHLIDYIMQIRRSPRPTIYRLPRL